MAKYYFKANIGALCKAREKVTALITSGNTSFKSVFAGEKSGVGGGWMLYLDEPSENWDNVYAVINEVKDEEGNLMDETDMRLISTEEYSVSELQVNGRSLKGQIIVASAAANRKNMSKEIPTDIQELADKKVEEGIVSKEGAEQRIQYMVDNNFDPILLKRVVEEWRHYDKEPLEPGCLYVDPYIENAKKMRVEGLMAENMRSALSRHGMIYMGDKSVGKNVCADTLTWLLCMPRYIITFSRQMTPSMVYGEKATDNSAADAIRNFNSTILKQADDIRSKRDRLLELCANAGETIPDADAFVKAMLSEKENEILEKAQNFEKLKAQAASVNIIIDKSELYDWLVTGGVMIFNEMNMAEANFFASFTNQLLDGTGVLFIPGRGEIPINKNCVLVGTQNENYEGTEQMNEATMSRFDCQIFQQPKTIKNQLVAAVKREITKDGFPNLAIDTTWYTQSEKFYNECNKAVKAQTVSNACLNIRGIARAIALVAESQGYMKLVRALELCVVNTCTEEDRDNVKTWLKQTVTV